MVSLHQLKGYDPLDYPMLSFLYFFLSWYGNNILYPKEDGEQKIHLYACRNCDHQVPLSHALICSKHKILQATNRGEEGMTLFVVCCNPSCGHRWRD
ncbi:DNA-directed RNA polymerases II, IV and V subunit 9A-like [Elaeis guineensis]|uniref:DNA-directed RNA polymerases II, IV and V subunit 9A-like n=1 Tax=Elaeis guineensis var. tenera TaxID=51953 RepID=UPI003C6D61F2